VLRKITVLLLAAFPVLLILPLGTSVSAAPTAAGDCPARFYTPDDRGSLFLNVCGPGNVIRGVNYNYEVVLTTKASHRTIKLSVVYYDPITRSSVPYRIERNPIYNQHAAVWTIKNLKPGQIFRVSIRLPFKQHRDPKASNFEVGVVAYGPRAGDPRGFLTKDVTFIKKK
jgi:hypothetical protein